MSPSNPPANLVAALGDRYRIDGEVGAGGMATVYRARDLKHGRDVAIKVLRPELAAVIGGERFLAEIETTAKLQHPHILPLFDSGAAGAFLYYVMPFVEGESLEDRLRREKQLPVDEAVRIAREAAEALAYAHRQGVVHRDIKPANLLLQAGSVLVSDFGISLAVREAGGERMTETGLSLGTPWYMSPEQATAERDVDARSDVYSVGAVLYEMLAGQPPHAGSSLQAVLASVITKPAPPVDENRPTIPSGLAAVVHKALERLPADRFQSADELLGALRDPTRFAPVPAQADPAGHVGPGSRSRGLRSALPWGVAGALGLLAAAGWLGRSGAAPESRPVRFELEAAPADLWLTAFQPMRVGLSPGGETVYFAALGPTGVPELFARRLDVLEPTRLMPERETVSPSASPDGRWLVGLYNRGARVMNLADGTVQDLAFGDPSAGTVTWGDDGLAYTTVTGGTVVRFPPSGGGADTLWVAGESDRLVFHVLPLPGSRTALLTHIGESPETMDLDILDLASGERRPLLSRAGSPAWLPFGVLAWMTPEGTIEGSRFDPETLEFMGEPRTLVTGGTYDGNTATTWAVSPSGVLAYETPWRSRSELVWVEMDGSERRVDADNLPDGPWDVAFSPDGTRLAIDAGAFADSDIWIHDFSQGVTQRLTTNPTRDSRPSWMDDGRVAFVSDRERDGVRTRAIWSMAVDGSDSARLEMRTDRFVQQAVWGRDGTMLYREGYTDAVTMRDIFVRRPGDDVARPLLATDWDEHSPALSPDARWVAYVSNEVGEYRVFVRSLDGRGGRLPVSAEAAISPLWDPDGRTLYYRTLSDSMVAADLAFDGATPRVTGRRHLFSTASYRTDQVDRPYDIHPDGDRFVFIRTPPATRIVVVTDWFSEVKEIMGIDR